MDFFSAIVMSALILFLLFLSARLGWLAWVQRRQLGRRGVTTLVVFACGLFAGAHFLAYILAVPVIAGVTSQHPRAGLKNDGRYYLYHEREQRPVHVSRTVYLLVRCWHIASIAVHFIWIVIWVIYFLCIAGATSVWGALKGGKQRVLQEGAGLTSEQES